MADNVTIDPGATPSAPIRFGRTLHLLDARAPHRVHAQLERATAVVFAFVLLALVRRFSERITVLVGGKVLTEGAPDEIMSDPRVREVYLGEGGHD